MERRWAGRGPPTGTVRRLWRGKWTAVAAASHGEVFAAAAARRSNQTSTDRSTVLRRVGESESQTAPGPARYWATRARLAGARRRRLRDRAIRNPPGAK